MNEDKFFELAEMAVKILADIEKRLEEVEKRLEKNNTAVNVEFKTSPYWLEPGFKLPPDWPGEIIKAISGSQHKKDDK